MPVWRVTGATVRGAIHVRRNTPNQDAIAWQAPADVQTANASNVAAPRLIALADGHGAPMHLRSNRGSRIAVNAAIALLDQFGGKEAGRDISELEELAREELPRELVRRWRNAVSVDMAKRPLAEWEIDALSEQVSPAALARLASDPVLAYGSTLLAVALTPRYILYMQLGDGDIVEIVGDGEARRPLPADPLLLGNATTSLCSAEAWLHVRVAAAPIDPDERSWFVMLSSDGYANSFENDAGLMQAASDLCTLSHEMGLPALSRELPGWLRATSAQGSGDDITVGLALRSSAG